MFPLPIGDHLWTHKYSCLHSIVSVARTKQTARNSANSDSLMTLYKEGRSAGGKQLAKKASRDHDGKVGLSNLFGTSFQQYNGCFLDSGILILIVFFYCF